MNHINSGCIGINLTQNQDTAVPFLAPRPIAQETALPCRKLVIQAQPELISDVL